MSVCMYIRSYTYIQKTLVTCSFPCSVVHKTCFVSVASLSSLNFPQFPRVIWSLRMDDAADLCQKVHYVNDTSRWRHISQIKVGTRLSIFGPTRLCYIATAHMWQHRINTDVTQFIWFNEIAHTSYRAEVLKRPGRNNPQSLSIAHLPRSGQIIPHPYIARTTWSFFCLDVHASKPNIFVEINILE